ncbi:arabinose-5-phosphate isomerase [Thermovibrio guaymasensis]|uniref:Arabinose-5-phosphate isomerase n=1 Tax=Thermovibrio guaymasensis TaxID=240167 RepID=A0A420W807_9BACT|nr:KpsF/GutQ family sugar-phosphate isomerase [Thermovibrio guaymasensis]RKQ63434.1 arabinose-5-phosphate isomerase [Thermovibrio guaymasensis]
MEEILKEGKRVLLEESQAIEKLARELNEDFIKAVELLHRTRGRVVLTGVGKSGLICKKIAATLSSTGTPAFFLHPTDAAHGDLGMVKGEDTVIAVSNSGETAELLSIIPLIKSFGIPVIAITSNPNSSLARLSDVVLNIGVKREACPLNLAPTTSTTVTLALGDAIAAALMKLKGFTPEEFAKFHPGGKLGIRLSKVKEIMRTGREIPIVKPDTPLKEAIFEISSKKIGATLVVENGKLVGIITDGDLRRALEKGATLETKVSELMTKNPKKIEEEAYGEEALREMEKHKITVLPVVNKEGKLKGIIHLHDILGRRLF